jgi:hypothetical protein
MRPTLLLSLALLLGACASRGSTGAAVESGYSTRTYYDPWHSPFREDQGPGHSIPLMH